MNRPELTADRFRPDLYGISERSYATGDLARLNQNGLFEYIGRIDHQVKLRGFRIELGEIENALLQFGAVKEAVVCVIETLDGSSGYLCAYIVTSIPDQTIDTASLRLELSRALPEYMVPSFFLELDALPLTPSGKVDRKALPEPDGDELRSKAYVAPRTELEEQLCTIWQEVLGVECVGIHDNFFELGGDSLKAVRVVSRIQETCERVTEVKDVFECPYVGSLSERLSLSAFIESELIHSNGNQSLSGLSYLQRSVWLVSQHEAASIAYNMFRAFEIEGELNVKALESAFADVIRRHSVLRTEFVQVDGEPQQRVRDQVEFTLQRKKVEITDDENQVIDALIGQEAAVPFDLSVAPLMRVNLLEIQAREKYILTFCMHHIISDGWSLAVLFKDLMVAYGSYCKGTGHSFNPLPVDYCDFVAWQSRMLTGARGETAREYWKNQLGDNSEPLALPTDKIRPRVKTYQGAVLRRELSSSVLHGLHQMAKQQGVTLFMTLVSAVKVLFYKYTGQSDITVGTINSGRDHPQLSDQVGFFINMLALRDHIRPDASFESFLQEVKQTMLAAYQHQIYPFDALVEDLNIQRDTSHTPLFDVLLMLKEDWVKPELPGVSVSNIEADRMYSAFDLQISFAEENGGLTLEIEYNVDLFVKQRIEAMVSHLSNLLGELGQLRGRKIRDIEIEADSLSGSTGSQEHDLCTRLIEADTTVPEMFSKQVDQTPDAVALVCGEESITYGILNEEASRLACRLRRAEGVEIGDYVGIHSEATIEAIIAILAVMKIGAAYVPIDPNYPERRKSHMLEQSGVRVVLKKPDHAFEFSGETVLLDRAEWGEYDDVKLEMASAPELLMYVIFTSGSTGIPKGAGVYQKSFVNLLNYFSESLKGNLENGNLLLTSLSFDLTQKNIFLPLVNGGTLYLPECRQFDPPRLVNQMMCYNPGWLNCTPSMFDALLECGGEQSMYELPVLPQVILGGETVLMYKIEPWLKQGGVVINSYGPTECTDVCNAYTVHQLSAPDSDPPVGPSILNADVKIIGQDLQPQVAGYLGEICISGVGVGLGYLGSPELTAEKFTPDPIRDGQRLYHAGDLGYLDWSGNVCFVGRNDSQVKVRGYRIELAEIEHALLKQEQVEHAVVIAWGGQDKRLCAYYSCQSPCESESLVKFLSAELPDYMIPSQWRCLESFKLNSNGKIDRSALPNPEELAPESITLEPAKNEIEGQLIRIWQEVLGLEQVGALSNFFDLGGHSLRIVRVASLIKQEFGFEMPMVRLFELPVLRDLAQEVEQLVAESKRNNQVIADMLAELEGLSDEEVEALLNEEEMDFQ